MTSLEQRIAGLTGRCPVRLSAMHGGCVSEVYLVEFDQGDRLVAKVDEALTGQLEIEARMLGYLAPHLPVPSVVHSSPGLMLMNHVNGSGSFSAEVQVHAAELLAGLHAVEGCAFGFEWDTVIGSLHQPNPETPSWIAFFGEHRLVYMAELAQARGRLPSSLCSRVETLAGVLDRFLSEPDTPSLLHGDIWSGNVLAADGRVQAFLDPAIYFGHPEVELAFIVMFSTFGTRFFETYAELRGIEDGFFEERAQVYNLYPNLVHVALFGGSYEHAVEQTLARCGIRS
ncbi:MAG: fructosamine kinase family protein [Planctomycetota bacterium]|nr:fructosamine kinase family protein [Planctomycetota bacterium]